MLVLNADTGVSMLQDNTVTSAKVVDASIAGTDILIGAGGVIERGSNANGEYVKFADGTLICFVNPPNLLSLAVAINTNYTTSSFTYPATFIAVPSVTYTFTTKDNLGAVFPSAFATKTDINSTTAIQFVLRAVLAFDRLQAQNIIAIGRWK